MSLTIEKKLCSRCKKKKPLSDFHVRSSSGSGLSYWCKNCVKKHQQTKKGKKIHNRANRKYNKTEKAKVASKKYHRSTKGKASKQKYIKTSKGKASLKKGGKKWHEKNGRKHLLKYKYNMTLEDFDKMVEQQKGVCAICGKLETAKDKYGNVRRLAVDHNHKTGKVRDLLCGHCNFLVGHIENNMDLVKQILKQYLKKHKQGWVIITPVNERKLKWV